jgi:hypothetical protein
MLTDKVPTQYVSSNLAKIKLRLNGELTDATEEELGEILANERSNDWKPTDDSSDSN